MKNPLKKSVPVVKFNNQGLSGNIYKDDDRQWAASTLVAWAKEKGYPVFKLPLAGIALSVDVWNVETIDDFARHAKRVMNTDLNHPILLDNTGFICDGWHRVVKALIEGKSEINAIRFEEMPAPDNR